MWSLKATSFTMYHTFLTPAPCVQNNVKTQILTSDMMPLIFFLQSVHQSVDRSVESLAVKGEIPFCSTISVQKWRVGRQTAHLGSVSSAMVHTARSPAWASILHLHICLEDQFVCVCAFISEQRVGEECSFSLSLYFLAVSPRLSPPCSQCETPVGDMRW